MSGSENGQGPVREMVKLGHSLAMKAESGQLRGFVVIVFPVEEGARARVVGAGVLPPPELLYELEALKARVIGAGEASVQAQRSRVVVPELRMSHPVPR